MKISLRSDTPHFQGYDLPQADLYALWRSDRRRILLRSCRSLAGMVLLCVTVSLLNATLRSAWHKTGAQLQREQAAMKEWGQRLTLLNENRTTVEVLRSHSNRFMESQRRRAALTLLLARLQASIPSGAFLEHISMDLSSAPERLTLNGGAENVHVVSEFREVLARFPILRKVTLIETSAAPELGARVVLFEFQCYGDGSLCCPEGTSPGHNAPKQAGRS